MASSDHHKEDAGDEEVVFDDEDVARANSVLQKYSSEWMEKYSTFHHTSHHITTSPHHTFPSHTLPHIASIHHQTLPLLPHMILQIYTAWT
jgi:hypothetical protein